ncbi:NAD(P)-dependent oxidoreductase [Streptomyces geranii]|uniref:NAD(P)-dependent oxidoreductase n=1 Tax=Streptomyces geranii TaxID=2058923 RepID=UPI000D039637|nr:NAD(P)-dependent oxidoreductase [Streptomyces geranii]
MRLGFIGAGRMGRPIVDRLRAAGHEVTVLVRRPESRASAAAAGLTCAGTVAETVRDADAVFVTVLTDEQVRSVCLGPAGAVAAMRPGATLVQHTTSAPATARLLAQAGAEQGIGVLDAALSGSPPDIAEGRLTLWVGGEETVLEAVRPLLSTYASPVLWVGAAAGDGQRVKLVNNALFVAQVGLAVDAVRLAGSLGIDERTLLAVLPHGSGASRALSVVAGGGSVDAVAGRLAALMRKDVAVVREVARSAGADLGIIGAVLASEAVESKVLGAARAPDDQDSRRAAS